jgi:hypothetical protein
MGTVIENDIQYLTNDAGEKTAVVVPIGEYQELMEDLSDLAVIAERKDEPTVRHDDLKNSLKADGII